LSHLRYACHYAGKDVKHWDTPEVKLTLRGLKKVDFKLYSGPKRAKFLLTEVYVQSLWIYNGACGRMLWAICINLSWCLLLRVQNESLLVWKGRNDDDVVRPDRQNGLFYEKADTLCFWMRTRKNRPQGSLLKLKCKCRQAGPLACVVCEARQYIDRANTGEVLWDFKPHVFLREMRQQCVMLGIAAGVHFTFKAFRAGMATHMARSGLFHVKEITQAGEWKGDSWQRYVDEDEVLDAVLNPCDALDRVLQESDSEEEE